MRIAIIAPGSRGDVEPYIALGKGLRRAGHDVRLVTHENFEAFVGSHVLEFRPIAGSPQEVTERADMRQLLQSGSGEFIQVAAGFASADTQRFGHIGEGNTD